MCLDKIKFKKAKLVLLSEDASDNNKQKFQSICEDNKIPCYIYGNKFDLSKSIGKDNKTVFAILDGNFAKSITKMLEDLRGAII
ncbi:MAG: ribosomal L7Ae/L30e/S12e/Gadd45 family protein [Clostridia bacterium]|nr:ribosomal L7Ae/L30e/S12e/Gadd45 family protein [Clostridia bacterium]